MEAVATSPRVQPCAAELPRALQRGACACAMERQGKGKGKSKGKGKVKGKAGKSKGKDEVEELLNVLQLAEKGKAQGKGGKGKASMVMQSLEPQLRARLDALKRHRPWGDASRRCFELFNELEAAERNGTIEPKIRRKIELAVLVLLEWLDSNERGLEEQVFATLNFLSDFERWQDRVEQDEL